jgi:catechol 2,3-dioxygenase-like lactoylglutathione lyase family enzyme
VSYNICIVMLFCQDLEQSRAFYTETLGMTFNPQMSSETFLLMEPPSGPPISLQPVSEAPEGVAPNAGGLVIGLEVRDVEATYADLKAKGVPVLNAISDVGVGRSFRAQDPDGRVFEITQFYPGFSRTPADGAE